MHDLGSSKLPSMFNWNSQSSACTSCCIFLVRLRVIGPVGTWSGVVVGEAAGQVDEVGEVVGEVAEVVGEVAEVVEEVAEVPDAGVVTSSSPLEKESSSTLPIQRMEIGRPH